MKAVFSVLIIISFGAFATYAGFKYVNRPYAPGCDACNSASIDNAGYRIPGVLKPRQTYNFLFSNGIEAEFFFSTPLSTYAFQQRGQEKVSSCTYACHQQNNQQKGLK